MTGREAHEREPAPAGQPLLGPRPVCGAAAGPADPARGPVSRRSVVRGLGAGAATGIAALAASAGFAGGLATRAGSEPRPGAGGPAAGGIGADGAGSGDGAASHPFHGEHQSGIVTPAQDRLHFAAFDVTTTDRERLVRLLQTWTEAAVAMTQGQPVGSGSTHYDAPPDDSGEALGLSPSRLTLTFGVGPTLFRDAAGKDRFGLADRQPRLLRRLPHFPGDQLRPELCDGDLCVQACADDPQVAVHAIRNLARLGFGTVDLRWSQLGYGRTSSTSTSQATPRNLFGFKDGTNNLKAEQPDEVDQHVWVARGDDPRADWLAGGSYLVARRIAMHLETWDRTSLREQERDIGRTRLEGAPLSGGVEHDQPDLTVRGREGQPLVHPRSHVALAHPDRNGGVRMLRRGYNYTDGSDGLGRIDAGLFFLCFVRDPAKQYVPMQTRLAKEDLLAEYLEHTGSGLWAVLPGVPQGGWLGQGLFA